MKRLKFFSVAIGLCLISIFAKAQNKQVQGVVRDAQGPLPGVTVFEKDITTNGVATGIDGRFKITLRGTTGVLVVRAVGYVTKEVVVGNSSTINVRLESSSQNLNEVAVVGYGVQKKITLTGAISAVSGSDIRENPSASLQNSLAGRVTGFISQQRSGQPGSDGATFYIRGQSSYTGNNQPLIIVDDIEFDYAQFARLDPNEVESITILKDASTTAVYGIKGANGVVVVTTRRGKIGKPQISLRTDFALQQPTKLPTYLDSYNTALLYDQAQINDNKYSASPNPNFQPRWSAADLALFQNGNDPYGHPNVNWKKELFKEFSTQYKTTFDVSGGTEKTKYFVSLGYLNQGGMTRDFSKGQGYDGNFYNQRYNYRSNLDINVSKSLNLRVDAYGNIGEINRPTIYYNNNGGKINGSKDDVLYEYGSFYSLSPYAYPIKNPDGSWAYSTYQNSENNSYASNNIIERLTLDGYNRTNENNMVLSTSANQKLDFITKGLSLKGTLAYTSNYSNFINLTRQNLPSFIYNPTTNTYTPTDPNVYRLERLGTSYTPNSTVRRVTAQAFLNYDRTFKNHHVTGLALLSQSSYTAALATTDLNYANYNYIPNNTLGYTTRIGYDYKQKYLLQFSGAYNGSSRFTGNKRFGLFPAGSVGYNIAEEPFFKKNIKFIDQLKFRGSYGIVGSDIIGTGFSYAYLQSYVANNGYITTPQGSVPAASFGTTNGTLAANQGILEGTLPNSNVTWEKQKELDLGIDFALFGKITGTVEYFNNNRYDILSTRGSISAIFGQTLPPVNLGKTNNKGYELELNYRNTVGKNFTYNFRGTYSYVRNKITYQDEPSVQYPWQAYTGRPIGAEALYHFIGFYKDAADVAASPKPSTPARPGDLKYEDLNKDGIIDSKDQAVSNITNVPTNNYGLQFGAGYKGFNISVLFQGAYNFNVRGYEESIRAFSSNLTSVHQQSWTPELGDNAKYPLISLQRGVSDPGSYNSDFWSIRGNYLRLRTAEASYSFPSKMVGRIGLQGVRVYLSGNNLITWSKAFKLYSLDPEYTPGTDRVNYPPQRIYNLGLSITFQ